MVLLSGHRVTNFGNQDFHSVVSSTKATPVQLLVCDVECSLCVTKLDRLSSSEKHQLVNPADFECILVLFLQFQSKVLSLISKFQSCF